MKGFIIDASYEVKGEETAIQLFGRLENGQSFISVHPYKPYFFIKVKDAKKHERLLGKYQCTKTDLTTFAHEPVAKVEGNTPAEIHKLYAALHKLEVDTYEADLKPAQRFLIDQDILGSLDIEGDWQVNERVDRVYMHPKIKPSPYTPQLKILSIDTESSLSGELYCIGLYASNYQKNFMITSKKLAHTVPCKDEAECLEKFKAEVQKLDPDIITGWNFIEYDLAYLQQLFKKHKISFDLGRTEENVRVRVESGFFRSSSADIPGRQVLDGLNLIRDPFIKEAPSIKFAEFDSHTLEDVSQALLGKGKLLKGKERHKEIENLYKTDQQKLVDYNLLDCRLVYEILEKTKIIELAVERSQLTGSLLDRITASIVAFDSLYIREARKKKLVSPTTRYGRKEAKITGGYVMQPKPGIYQNVLVLDFKSLYPSIIRTFNIDPASFLKHKEKDSIEAPNKAYFRNEEGILPGIIQRLHEAREKAKKEKREFSNYAIKIIMNSFYGVLASQNSRYFDFDMANAITHFAQFIIKMTAKEIEKLGHKVIYQDTDSVFVVSDLSKTKAHALGTELQENINSFYANYVKKEFQRHSFLELQFEKLYLSMLFPRIRAGKDEDKAAKKRYAGLLEKEGKEELEIVGLEAIRGDWTEAAQEFQRELLLKVFHQETIDVFIQEFIQKILSGKYDNKLIYRKSIRKGLDEYTKTTPPHVKAARQLDSLESNVIEYYITEAGPEPIQKQKHKLDYEHYIKKQIEPIANQVLSLLGKTLAEASSGSKQATLF
ncbi:DNA polymerase II [Candidatus Pacearchaeota archaeon]|nr:DNA polymerase II [Candidatus Pacearchaeota archaeon]